MTDTEFKTRFAAARRRAIARDFPWLNDMQLEGVLTTEGPLLLLAGAGSGKTTVLINRIANLMRYGRGSDCGDVSDDFGEEELRLLEEYAETGQAEDIGFIRSLCAVDPVEPWRIIAITFTNKAADELKARLERMLGESARDIWAKTFHSACVRILRRDIDRLGYNSDFTIYDTSDSQSLMKRILKELELDEKQFPNRTVLGYISRAKDAMLYAEDFCADAEKSGDVRKKAIGRAYTEYEKRMRAANALDFDDIILLTVQLLTDYEDVRDHYRRLFRYVLIDEYQDTNNLQYRLARLLVGKAENICVVGDDDQSIYKFRGATIENILNFEKQYKNARVIKLEQNYRSTGNILAAANDVIANNRGRKGKKLWTEQKPGGLPQLYVADNERDEAQYVAERILTDVAAGGRLDEHAVLYRMNAQSNSLEYAFKRNAIPYKVIGGTRFFDRAEVKDMLAYLCVVNNTEDDLRLLRIINNPPRGIGAKTVESAQAIAAEYGISLFSVLGSSRDYPELERSAGKLHLFYDLIEELRQKSTEMPLDEFYDLLVETTGYVKMLSEKGSEDNTSRIENVGELKSNIINYLQEAADGTLSGFLDEIALYTDIDSLDSNTDCVVMMTMHSAKGLEFPVVFIVGAEEGLFPSSRVIGEAEEMEEERRLCYVAMTRAKKELILTSARQRMMFGRTQTGMISRFVDEISEEHISRPASARRAHAELPEGPFGFGQDYSYGSGHGSGGGYGRRGATSVPRRSHEQSRSFSAKPVPRQTPSSVRLPEIRKGDRVEHKAFGSGFVTDVKPTGGDALLEIAFDKVGTKRLMLKAAAAYMKIMKG